ncbi:hypothetical protein BC832DRAFT_549601 [Gaertneriomyces semiglobifer]|nr:hypothetical protein BC832DRAFT_549601 [Gaertneriomyces semiglobifer]
MRHGIYSRGRHVWFRCVNLLSNVAVTYKPALLCWNSRRLSSQQAAWENSLSFNRCVSRYFLDEICVYCDAVATVIITVPLAAVHSFVVHCLAADNNT